MCVGRSKRPSICARDTPRLYFLLGALIERMLPHPRAASEWMIPRIVFYAPLRSIPETIKEPGRSLLTKAIGSAIFPKTASPQIEALHDFLRHEYLPRARTGIALSELPLGGPVVRLPRRKGGRCSALAR